MSQFKSVGYSMWFFLTQKNHKIQTCLGKIFSKTKHRNKVILNILAQGNSKKIELTCLYFEQEFPVTHVKRQKQEEKNGLNELKKIIALF